MREKRRNSGQVNIEWDLNCNYDDAIKFLSESAEIFFLPYPIKSYE